MKQDLSGSTSNNGKDSNDLSPTMHCILSHQLLLINKVKEWQDWKVVRGKQEVIKSFSKDLVSTEMSGTYPSQMVRNGFGTFLGLHWPGT